MYLIHSRSQHISLQLRAIWSRCVYPTLCRPTDQPTASCRETVRHAKKQCKVIYITFFHSYLKFFRFSYHISRPHAALNGHVFSMAIFEQLKFATHLLRQQKKKNKLIRFWAVHRKMKFSRMNKNDFSVADPFKLQRIYTCML